MNRPRTGWVLLGYLALCLAARGDRLDLSGEWLARRDSLNTGLSNRWQRESFLEPVELPGFLREEPAQAQLGPDPIRWGLRASDLFSIWRVFPPEIPEPAFLMRRRGYLCPARPYVGPAWYAREVVVPGHWQGERIILTLERCSGGTTLWVDGESAGRRESLAVPQEYELTELLDAGPHRLVLRVDGRRPRDAGHENEFLSDSQPAAWNGLMGRIELRTEPRIWIRDLQVDPDPAAKVAKLTVTVCNAYAASGEGTLAVEASCANAAKPLALPKRVFPISISGEESRLAIQYPLGANAPRWDQDCPAFFRLKVILTAAVLDRSACHVRESCFGLRHIETVGGRVLWNGRPLESGVLLLPERIDLPTDVDSWRRVWQACLVSGYRLARLPSWCPPEAAFMAADESGFLLMPHPNCWVWKGIVGQNAHLRRETAAMVRTFAHHPSLVVEPDRYDHEP